MGELVSGQVPYPTGRASSSDCKGRKPPGGATLRLGAAPAGCGQRRQQVAPVCWRQEGFRQRGALFGSNPVPGSPIQPGRSGW